MNVPLRSVQALLTSALLLGVLFGVAAPTGTAATLTATDLAAAPGAPRIDTATPLPISVSLTSVTPVALAPDSVMTVTGTVRNIGRTTFSALQVVLRLDWRVLDRRQIAEWAALDPKDPANGTRQNGVPLGRRLAPGETAGFTVTMRGDSAQLPVDAKGFGPRKMAIEIQNGAGRSGPRVGILRTFAVWNPVQEYSPTRLAILVPVTSGHQPVDPKGEGGQVPQLWGKNGRLARLLTATADHAFSYAIDPSLVAAAIATQTPQPARPRGAPGDTGTTPTTTQTPSETAAVETPAPAPQSGPRTAPFDPAVAARAKEILTDLRTSLADRESFTLPYADPDVAALADGYRSVLDDADREATDVTRSALAVELPGQLVWPVNDKVDQATANLAADGSGRTLVLPSSMAGATRDGGTAPAHASLSLPNGQADALVSDDVLSSALADTGGRESTLATQRLLAETAAVTAAHPAESPVVLATVPRAWNPEPAGVTSSLSTLRNAPWIQLDRVGAARMLPPSTLERPNLSTAAPAPNTQLPGTHVRIIARQLQRLEDFTPALVRQEDVARKIGPVRRSALEMLSTCWISRQKGVGPARGVLTTEVNRLYGSLAVVGGSSANLLAETGQLPVTVDNQLDAPVRVYLDLHPASALVRVTGPVLVDVEAFKTRTVRVPLQAVGNGDVQIEGTLRLPAGAGGSSGRGARIGAKVGNTSTIDVRVHYDWADRGLVWIGVVLALLLVAGLFRSVRRGRRVQVPPDSVPDPDDVGREPVTPPSGTPAVRSPLAPPDARAAAPATSAGGPGTGGGAPSSVAIAARNAPARLSVSHDAAPQVSTPPPRDGGSPPEDGSGPGGSPVDGGRTAGLLSSGAVMAAGTLASRVLGVVRTVVLAWAIGQIGLSADAFATANTLPNSLMALIAGGVLNAVLVPQIVRAAKRSDGGKDYLDRLLTLAIIVLGGATLVATALAPVLFRVFGTATWSPAQMRLGTAFALWCLPQIFFYGLYTIYGQVLNARGSFGPYMWAPVVNNIVAIAGTLVFVVLCGSGAKAPEWWSAGPIALLAGTATLGIVAQALVLLPAMRRSGYTWRPRIGWRGIGLSRAGRVAGWTLAATAAGQFGFIFISQAANSGGAQAARAGGRAGGRQLYDNAYLLFILPHSLVAVSLITAVFTRMSISAGANRTDEVRADASLALRLTGLATVISTAAVLVLGEDFTRAIMIFNSRTETDALALSTMAMILGLVPFSAQYLFTRIFYAYEDARTPFWIALVTICTWVAGSLLSAATLSPAWVVPGIGLAMSVSNLVGASLSAVIATRRLGGLDGGALVRAHLRFALAASVAAAAGWAASTGIHTLTGSGLTAAYLCVAGVGGVMLAVYLGLLHLLRSPELAQILAPLRARGAR